MKQLVLIRFVMIGLVIADYCIVSTRISKLEEQNKYLNFKIDSIKRDHSNSISDLYGKIKW